MRKKFVLVKIFRFSENHEKCAKNDEKCRFFRIFSLIKTCFRRSFSKQKIAISAFFLIIFLRIFNEFLNRFLSDFLDDLFFTIVFSMILLTIFLISFIVLARHRHAHRRRLPCEHVQERPEVDPLCQGPFVS